MPDFVVYSTEHWAKWQALHKAAIAMAERAKAFRTVAPPGGEIANLMDALHAIDGDTIAAALSDAPQRPAVALGDELFAFKSLTDWINNAKELFANNYPRSRDAICIDTKGRICSIGEHFRTASNEGTYPIRVFMKRSA